MRKNRAINTGKDEQRKVKGKRRRMHVSSSCLVGNQNTGHRKEIGTLKY